MSAEALEKRFTDLHDRLAVLQDATNQLKELIDRLANFDFRPGSIPLSAGDDDNVGAELGNEINQILREQEEELELLNEEIVDVRPGRPGSELHHDKERLRDGAQRLGQELQNCRKSFRKAQISAKRNLDIARRQEREALYASFANTRSGASSPSLSGTNADARAALFATRRKPYVNKSEMSKEEQTISASNDVTQSMRRTHDLMAAELSKSDFAHSALKESTAALGQLSESYSSLDTMLSSSRALLGTLMKSQKTDTWYLQSAFYILLVTIGWLVWRRLLWGPTWWLVWLPLKLVFRTTVGVTNMVRRRGDSQVKPGSDPDAVSPGFQQASMNNENVPTIQVGQPPEQSSLPVHDPESIVEQVGKMVDEAQDETNIDPGMDTEETGEDKTELRERMEDEAPNPKKRMMEEPPTQEVEPQRPKDEL